MRQAGRYVWAASTAMGWMTVGAQDVADADDDFHVYRVGALYADDNAYALNAGADWAVTRSGRLQLSAGYARGAEFERTGVSGSSSRQFSGAWEQRFDSWGGSLGAGYGREGDNVDTKSVRGRVFYDNRAMRVGALFERREIEVSYDLPEALRAYAPESRTVDSHAYGLDLRFAGKRLTGYFSGAYYDYSDPLEILVASGNSSQPTLPPQAQARLAERLAEVRSQLGSLTATSLRVSDSLLDYSLSLGVDYILGDYLLNAELTRDRAALDSAIINSVSAGWVLPLGLTADLELRLGATHIDELGTSLYGGVMVSIYR
jgi:hypothetical protein